MVVLEQFIVEAKAACYVGGGRPERRSSRAGSHDIAYHRDHFHYVDSYFGGTDFIGQELVWIDAEPVWAMNYYGRIVQPTRLDAARAGMVIRSALAQLYREGRFLGGHAHAHVHGDYIDETVGDHRSFIGVERILVDGILAYQLDYHGGIIKP